MAREAIAKALDDIDRNRRDAGERAGLARQYYLENLSEKDLAPGTAHACVSYLVAANCLSQHRSLVIHCMASHPEFEVWGWSLVRQMSRLQNWTDVDFVQQREDAFRKRGIAGPRSSLWKIGQSSYPPGMFLGLREEIEGSPAVRRREILRWVGETGGAEEAELLSRLVMPALEGGDEKYLVDLVSALTGIGGKESVEALLVAARKGSEQVSVGALAGLEDLASIGSEALTDAATPRLVPKNSEEWKYVESIIARIEAIAEDPRSTPYVKHSATQAAEFLKAGLG